MPDFIMRCSALGEIMGEPRSKSAGPLSETAKSYIREQAAQDILGIDFIVTSRQFDKGNACEPEAIALINRVHGLSMVKNTERRTRNRLTGECDMLQSEPRREIRDAKCAWSAATFPITVSDIISSTLAYAYEWQGRGYMYLWDAERFHVDYVLLDTPIELIGYEPPSLHVVGHIPEHMRITTWTIERDAEKEALIETKIAAASAYYDEVIGDFERTHKA
jgi:hypothetical protein